MTHQTWMVMVSVPRRAVAIPARKIDASSAIASCTKNSLQEFPYLIISERFSNLVFLADRNRRDTKGGVRLCGSEFHSQSSQLGSGKCGLGEPGDPHRGTCSLREGRFTE